MSRTCILIHWARASASSAPWDRLQRVARPRHARDVKHAWRAANVMERVRWFSAVRASTVRAAPVNAHRVARIPHTPQRMPASVPCALSARLRRAAHRLPAQYAPRALRENRAMEVPRPQPARAGHKAKPAPRRATSVATNPVIQPPVLKSVLCAIVDRTLEKRCDRKKR